MPFDEFLAKRLTELLRFAAVLIGDTRLATDVVVDVLCRAFPDWPALAVGGRPFVAVRTGVVRRYLDGSMPQAPGLFGALGRPARAAVVLTVYSGQTTGEAADAMRTTVPEAESLIAGARASLAGSGGNTTLVDRLDHVADIAEFDVDAAAAEVLDRLERGEVDDVSSDLFAPAQLPAQAPAPARPVYGPGDGTAGASEHDHPHPLFAFFDDDDDHHDEVVDDAEPAEQVDGLRQRSRGTRAPGRTTPLRILAVAVMVAAAVLVSLVVQNDRRDSSADVAAAAPMTVGPTAPVAPRVDPSTRIGHPLPGTRQLGAVFFGSGSGIEHGGDHIVARGRELAIDATCSGSGGATIGPVVIATCDTTPVGAVVTPVQIRSLRISTQAATTWRFAIVDEPAHDTNGALMYPVNGLIEAGSPTVTVARSSGSGSARVALQSGATTPRVVDVRLLLTCTGSGVSFASSDHVFDGQYTHTCFEGWSYEFDVDGADLPGTLVVEAAAGTSWHLAVVRR